MTRSPGALCLSSCLTRSPSPLYVTLNTPSPSSHNTSRASLKVTRCEAEEASDQHLLDSGSLK